MFMGDFPRISAFYCPSSHFGSFDQTEISNKTLQKKQKLSFTINCRPAEQPRDSPLSPIHPVTPACHVYPCFCYLFLTPGGYLCNWMILVAIGMSCFSYLPSLPRDQVRHEYISLKNEVNTWQGPHLLVKWGTLPLTTTRHLIGAWLEALWQYEAFVLGSFWNQEQVVGKTNYFVIANTNKYKFKKTMND